MKFLWIILALAWVFIIVSSGAGWNPLNVGWNFSNSGAFGDSFGPLSALMASLAAIAAFSGLAEQRQAALLAEARESDRDQKESKREFETTFFNFLGFFEKIVAQTDIDRGTAKNQKVGKDSFAFILQRIENKIKINGEQQSQSFQYFFDEYINDLAHYFRTLYNLIDFVDKSDIENKYFYVKIVRATMSDSELGLVALNCLHHAEGNSNLKPLVEKYHFLNNLSQKIISFYDLKTKFEVSAFGLPNTN